MAKPQTVEELRAGIENPSLKSPASKRKYYLKMVIEGRCVQCGKDSPDGTRLCPECKVKAKPTDPKYSAAWRRQKFCEGLCTHCGKESAAFERKLCSTCSEYFRLKAKDNYKRNPTMWKAATKAGLRKLRLEVFAAYGGPSCACCGEAVFEFLTIDHIDNGGAKHRKELFGRRTGGRMFYSWLKSQKFPPGYQVYCMNCNWGKHANGGTCPHKTAVKGTV